MIFKMFVFVPPPSSSPLYKIARIQDILRLRSNGSVIVFTHNV